MDANTLLLLLVIALEPLPILAGVLLLTTESGRPKAVAFFLGWALALIVVAIVTAVVGDTVSTPSGSTSSKVSAILDILLGLIALFVALRTRRRIRPGEAGVTPNWMSKLDTMRPVAAFGLGCFLPPYMLVAAVANQVIRLDLDSTQRTVAVVLFVIIGSIGVLVPIGLTVVRPRQSAAVLATWREWLEVNWMIIVFWLLAFIGVYLVVKGVVELGH